MLMLKKCMSSFVIGALLISLFGFTVSADENWLTISSATELSSIGTANYPLSGKFKLSADIDLSAIANWVPIGTAAKPFTGELDGNGKTISGLKSNQTANYIGLFGYSTGKISNLTVVSPTLTSGTNVLGAGAIAGFSSGTIDNCVVSNPSIIVSAKRVGGIVGEIKAGTVSNSSVTGGTVTGNASGGYERSTGGFVGVIQAASTASNNTVSNVTVTRGGFFGGGFAGLMYGTATACTVSNVTITSQDNTGGFVGSNFGGVIKNSTVSDCTVNGAKFTAGFVGLNGVANDTSVTNTLVENSSVSNTTVNGSKAIVAGFAGANQASSTIKYCTVSNTNVTGQNNRVGGFVGENRTLSTILNSSVQNGIVTGAVADLSNQVGGFAGRNAGTVTTKSNISTSTAKGMTVVGKSTEVGGFLGSNEASNVSDCIAENVRVTAYKNDAGGFVGWNNVGSAIVNSVAINNITEGKMANTGGFAGLNDAAINTSSVEGGSVKCASVVSGFANLGLVASGSDNKVVIKGLSITPIDSEIVSKEDNIATNDQIVKENDGQYIVNVLTNSTLNRTLYFSNNGYTSQSVAIGKNYTEPYVAVGFDFNVDAITLLAKINNNDETSEAVPQRDRVRIDFPFAYLYGYEYGDVGAQDTIKREEAAALIYRLLKQNNKLDGYSNPNQSHFSDVATNRWSFSAIEYMTSISVFDTGIEKLKPGQEITRGEASKIIAFSMGLQPDSDKAMSFTDLAKGHRFYNSIKALVDNGILIGYTDNTINPDGFLTRAEYVTMINRLIGRDDTYNIDNVTNLYPDLSINHWAYNDILRASLGFSDDGTGQFIVDPAKKLKRSAIDYN